MQQFRKRLVLACFLMACSFLKIPAAFGQQISLAGEWRFSLDREDQGMEQKWFDHQLTGSVRLPGSLNGNGIGDEVSLQTRWTGSIYDSSFFFRPSLAKYRQPDNLKIPFWLTPLKYYVGPAWYQKEVTIPQNWKGKNISLVLERVHFISRIWIDGKEVGGQNSLSVAQTFEVSRWLTPGKHTITIRIDNRLKDANVGPDSNSVSDHTQGNWNGLIGNLYVQARPQVFVEDVQIFPDVKNKTALVRLSLVNSGSKAAKGRVEVGAQSFNVAASRMVPSVSASVSVAAGDTSRMEINLPMGRDVLLWDEFSPALYHLTASVTVNNVKDERRQQFGMREITVEGTHLAVNGKIVSLRGTVNNCEFPLTGYPPMDVASWERIFRIARAHGLNHMRFHSFCPPEAAFIAADKVGFYLQPEGPSWPNHGTSLGDGRFIDQYLYDETGRMVKAYGNYASFCMLSAGNEPAGRNQAKYLGAFVKYWMARDSRRVYTGASVAQSWPLVPENQYMIKSGARGLNWSSTRPEDTSDYRAAIAPFHVPYVVHEMGQWCVFPNFKEIKKYTGDYRARNFELFQQDLADHGMADQAEDFLNASGKLQALCYKSEIEKTMRTPGLGGFALLGLQDFPGQGTALVGVLDAFWDEKGYISAKAFSRFCNAVVPLCRMPKFVYTNNETFSAAVELYNFGPSDLQNATFTYTIRDKEGKVWHQGQLVQSHVERGNCIAIGKIDWPLKDIQTAEKLNLEVALKGTSYVNDWDFWVYPQVLPELRQEGRPAANDSVYYCSSLDAKAEDILNKGGKVFLNAAGKVVKGKEVVMYFTPIFWNTSWFKMRPPHVTGILVQDKHPGFEFFPTENHSNLQWWEIVNRAQVMNLEDFPKGFKPLVQPIDTWFMNRRLALLFEARVGKGKLIVSSADLLSDTARRPAARQLWYSISRYMLSGKFNPQETVDLNVVKDIFLTPSREQWSSFTKDSPDELKPKK